jgi:hypothetical protein
MTPLLTTEAFVALGAPYLVYVRPMKASELMVGNLHPEVSENQLHPDQMLYAVHRADGERLAVLTNKESAFAAATAHDLAPVSVH